MRQILNHYLGICLYRLFGRLKARTRKSDFFRHIHQRNIYEKSDYGIDRNRFLMPDMNSMGILIIYRTLKNEFCVSCQNDPVISVIDAQVSSADFDDYILAALAEPVFDRRDDRRARACSAGESFGFTTLTNSVLTLSGNIGAFSN